MAVRRLLHRRGLRYRKDLRVDVDGEFRVRPDVVFPRLRLALFIDGCWWHRCPIHANQPKANAAYWEEKFRRNLERDQTVTAAMEAAGWLVLRFWEHEDPKAVADVVACAVEERRAAFG